MYYKDEYSYEQGLKRVKKELKENPSLINDLFYVFNNLPFIGLKFADFSEEIKKNPIFVLQYFSQVQVHKSDWKNLPKEYLNSEQFVQSVIKMNPDIYLILDETQKTFELYQFLEKNYSNKILKYAPAYLFSDSDYCKRKIIESHDNYRYAPEEIRRDKKLCEHIFSKAYNSPLIKFLPTHLKQDKEFLLDILFHPDMLSYLPKEIKENSELCSKLVKKNSKFFYYISPNLQEDKKFVEELISEYQYHCNYGGGSKDFNFNYILPYLSIEFFNPTFLSLFKEEIYDSFSSLTKEQRKNYPIIGTAFSYMGEIFGPNSDIDNMKEIHRYIKDIEDQDLKKQAESFIAHSKENNLHLLVLSITDFIKSYCFKTYLNEQLDKNSDIKKKFKI